VSEGTGTIVALNLCKYKTLARALGAGAAYPQMWGRNGDERWRENLPY
jgi:hypothetical protein